MNPRNRENQIKPPPFSYAHIVETAENIGADLIRQLELPPSIFSISFDVAYQEIIYPRYEITLDETQDLGYELDGTKILGSYDPLSNTAFIDKCLKYDPRRTFTCWHEVGGHAILQGEWLRREWRRLRSRKTLNTIESDLDLTTTDVLERQANLFAAHAGAPTALLYFAADDLLSLNRPVRYVGPGEYTLVFRGQWHWLKVDSLNHLCRIIAKQIQWRFGNLSIEALSYRIQNSSLIHDITAPPFRLYRTERQMAKPDFSSNAKPALCVAS